MTVEPYYRLQFKMTSQDTYSLQDVIDTIMQLHDNIELLPVCCSTLPGRIGNVVGFETSSDGLDVKVHVSQLSTFNYLTSCQHVVAYAHLNEEDNTDSIKIDAIILDPVVAFIAGSTVSRDLFQY